MAELIAISAPRRFIETIILPNLVATWALPLRAVDRPVLGRKGKRNRRALQTAMRLKTPAESPGPQRQAPAAKRLFAVLRIWGEFSAEGRPYIQRFFAYPIQSGPERKKSGFVHAEFCAISIPQPLQGGTNNAAIKVAQARYGTIS